MIVAGIDEAGYGPLLGPLVVSAAVFRVPGSLRSGPPDLWAELAPAVDRSPRPGTVAVNDSKRLFQQGRGFIRLEEGVLTFLRLRDRAVPRDLRALLERVARRSRDPASGYLDQYPWYKGRTVELPVETFPNAIEKLAGRLAERMEGTRIEFLGFGAVPFEVSELNRLFARTRSKADVSMEAIGWLVKRLWRRFPSEPIDVIVDRQGGRTYYAAQLFSRVRPRGIHIDEQSQEHSVYRLLRRKRGAPPLRVTFAKGSEEKHLPVALASMLSKYLRELHMALFNAYFLEHRRNLRPTAGYVTDARRFLRETEDLRRELGIDHALLVRAK